MSRGVWVRRFSFGWTRKDGFRQGVAVKAAPGVVSSGKEGRSWREQPR